MTIDIKYKVYRSTWLCERRSESRGAWCLGAARSRPCPTRGDPTSVSAKSSTARADQPLHHRHTHTSIQSNTTIAQGNIV